MTVNTTPMMKQYLEIKSRNKDAILFFRMGDFYEMFGDDAKTASGVLQIALTSRNTGAGRENKLPMCGVPYHAANAYIYKLINSGYKVAVCEQVEDPKTAKGIVKRDVVKIISPGTIFEESALDRKSNNFILSLYFSVSGSAIAYIDISTGEFYAAETGSGENYDAVIDEIEKVMPSEVLIPEAYLEDKKLNENIVNRIKGSSGRIFINPCSSWNFSTDAAKEKLKDHFGVESLDSFGIESKDAVISAAGGLLAYIYETQKTMLHHINKIKTVSLRSIMYLDAVSLRNLEVTDSEIKNVEYPCLFDVLDFTRTAMGSRTMKKWLKMPLTDTALINERHDITGYFTDFSEIRENIRQLLGEVSDIERISGKLGSAGINGRDLISLRKALEKAAETDALITESGSELLMKKFICMNENLKEVIEIIRSSIADEPPITIKEGGIIKPEYDEELKKIIDISQNGRKWIAELQEKERKRTGISSLKVGYTSVFGYYIEISKANLKNTPDDYIRKQTLVNAERFITPDLKEYESMILGAQERIKNMEYEIFRKIREKLEKYIPDIQQAAEKTAELDCLAAFSVAAERNNYVRPVITENGSISIKNGRHPVVEKNIGYNEFIANDCIMDTKENMIMVITGPNMAGKSTYMRQSALILLMAQAGSFVPADSAEISITDRIFTRVGAADYLARGQSTFMVEMIETANILNNATEKSLIILDEVGRGTSTFDGVSIAWAITEHIHNKIKAKTLFATHYFELTETADLFEGVQNYSVQVKDYGDRIVFLRKIIKGSTDRSYGIHVAQLAGLPKDVVERAEEVLKSLEEANYAKDGSPKIGGGAESEKQHQPGLFDVGGDSKIGAELKKIDINNMTPVEALQKLVEIINTYS
ncbi:MAG: DNA mismatch repair protein MutS [Candidatus Goldiibacteriota bacterium]